MGFLPAQQTDEGTTGLAVGTAHQLGNHLDPLVFEAPLEPQKE
jgi:hypothetical protein